MNDLSKLQILYVVVGIVLAIVIWFGSEVLVGVDEEYSIWGWFFVLAGVFAVCGAVFNLSVFMNARNQNTRALRELLGESFYRLVMVVLGSFMIFLGLLLTKAIEL